MPTFPAIQLPDLGGFSEQVIDSTIRTPMEAGYTQTRPRYNIDPYLYSCAWEENPLSDTDYLLLKAFFAAVRVGAAVFTWTHPIRKTTHDARLYQVSEFTPVSVGGSLGWRGRIVVEVLS